MFTLAGADGGGLGLLGADPVWSGTVTLDRGGFGLRVGLDQPRRVLRGENHTLLIVSPDHRPVPPDRL